MTPLSQASHPIHGFQRLRLVMVHGVAFTADTVPELAATAHRVSSETAIGSTLQYPYAILKKRTNPLFLISVSLSLVSVEDRRALALHRASPLR